MTIFVKSLVNYDQTIDGKLITPFALQEWQETSDNLDAAEVLKTIEIIDVPASGDVLERNKTYNWNYISETDIVQVIPNDCKYAIIETTGQALDTLNITMPSSPLDNQELYIYVGSGSEEANLLTVDGSSVPYASSYQNFPNKTKYIYNKFHNKWFTLV
jgi:hypothetical protein